jgi:hypothetical protein
LRAIALVVASKELRIGRCLLLRGTRDATTKGILGLEITGREEERQTDQDSCIDEACD